MCRTAGENSYNCGTSGVEPGYEKLNLALQMALNQAMLGKGKERHACGEPFSEQLIMTIERLDVGFQLGQAIKKIVESKRLDKEHSINELLGAIIYIAAQIILLKEH
jgi:hypothetical protein